MRKCASLIAVAVIILSGMAASCSKKGTSLKEYAADVLTTTPRGEFSGKLYVQGGESRMELPNSIIIARQDTGTVQVFMSAKKFYLELPMKPEYVYAVDGKFPGEVSRERVGTEKVDGRDADKYRVTYKLGDKGVTVYQWVCTKSGMPLKTAAVDGTWSYSLSNIKGGSQPDELFELLPGYQKLNIPMPQFKTNQ